MATHFTPPQAMADLWLSRAEDFAQQLQQSQGVRKDGKNIVLTYIVDGAKPDDQVSYAEENVDGYALAAYQHIFSDDDEVELLLKDIRLTFAVLFWNGLELHETEFTYYMNDLQFLRKYIHQKK